MTTPDPITTALGFTEDDAARILAEQYSDGRDYDLIRYSEQWIDREKAIAAIMAATVIASEQIQMLKTGMDKAYDDLAESSREWAGWQTRANTAETEITRLTSLLEQAERVIRAQEKALKLHHTWQGSDEPYGLELTPGNWIELNRGAEYADSSMYEVTMEAFRAASQWIKDRHEKQALSELHTEEQRLGLE